ncbi:MAG: hypothetical protein KJ927_04115 [Candidatus Eisenbacteria bacterium]|nr:hypothetical protein [Candidatus Eisenbacteria bacterium]
MNPSAQEAESHNPTASQLTQEDIAEFRAIARAETGIEMTEGEAWNRAIELIAMVRMLLGPLPEDSEGLPNSDGSNIVPPGLTGHQPNKNARVNP